MGDDSTKTQENKYGRYPTDFGWKAPLKATSLLLPGENDADNYKPGQYIHRMMKGVTIADSKSIAGFTPFITGRNIFLVTKMPKFLETVMAEETALFKHLTQFYTKGITGFQDLNLNMTTIENGSEAAGWDIATSISGDTRSVTIEYGPEMKGAFISTYVRYWMNGIIDSLSDTGTYLGAFDQDESLEWDVANHTMEGIQIILDPTRRKIESHVLIVGMHPTNASGQIFETTAGQHDLITPSIQYSAKCYPNLADISEVLAEIDVCGYIRTARFNTISMKHVLDDRKESVIKEVSRITESFDTDTGRQNVQLS